MRAWRSSAWIRSRAQHAHGLIDHVRLLLAWNQAINLSAIRDPRAAVREHILDSLSAVELLRARQIDALLDLGSGGGYPGLPLALALPARRCLLVESVGKKAAFLSAAAHAGTRNDARATGRSTSSTAGPRPWLPITATANGGRRSWPGRSRRSASLPRSPCHSSPGAGCSSPGSAGRSTRSSQAAEPAIELLGGSRPAVLPVTLEGLEDHVLVVIDEGRSLARGLPARSRPAPTAAPGDRRATTLALMRVAVLSDIHANIRALDAILAQAGKVDAVWHLGDVVGYGPDPDAVV